jgi:uncharacterized Zn finger protein
MARRAGLPCRRCGGQLFFEQDLLQRHIVCKCLQCGNIAAYLWVEPGHVRPFYETAGHLAAPGMLVEDGA